MSFAIASCHPRRRGRSRWGNGERTLAAGVACFPRALCLFDQPLSTVMMWRGARRSTG